MTAVVARLGEPMPERPGKGWRRYNTHCVHGHLLTGFRINTRDDRRGTVYTMRYCIFCARKRGLRSGRGTNWRRNLERCPKGHPYVGRNLGIQVIRERDKKRETRMCVTCRRESQARYAAKIKQEAGR